MVKIAVVVDNSQNSGVPRRDNFRRVGGSLVVVKWWSIMVK